MFEEEKDSELFRIPTVGSWMEEIGRDEKRTREIKIRRWRKNWRIHESSNTKEFEKVEEVGGIIGRRDWEREGEMGKEKIGREKLVYSVYIIFFPRGLV